MADPAKLKKWINRLPVEMDEVIASGVALFIENQDPDDIDMTFYNNGWQLTVRAEPEDVEEMKEFWNDDIETRL